MIYEKNMMINKYGLLGSLLEIVRQAALLTLWARRRESPVLFCKPASFAPCL